MMSVRKSFVIGLLVLIVSILAAACAETGKKPTVTLSTDKVLHKGWVSVKGAGFTPKANVSSHLLKPDGREFPVLPMLTDERGEITHEIDTLLLAPGFHDLWIIDDTSGESSNVARFEVTLAP